MKKICMLLLVMLILCGCSREDKITLENETIETLRIFYHAEEDKVLDYYIAIDFDEVDTSLNWKDLKNEEEKSYKIYDIDAIEKFLKDIPSKTVDNAEEHKNDSEEQLELWSIRIRTNEKVYNFSGYVEYPTYWEELWNVLVEATEAESIADFGFTVE